MGNFTYSLSAVLAVTLLILGCESRDIKATKDHRVSNVSAVETDSEDQDLLRKLHGEHLPNVGVAYQLASSRPKLPPCLSIAEGLIWYVISEKTFYVCNAQKTWQTVDLVGPQGPQGNQGTPGAKSVVLQETLPVGSVECPTGGVRFNSFLDVNQNNTYESDIDGVSQVNNICNLPSSSPSAPPPLENSELLSFITPEVGSSISNTAVTGRCAGTSPVIIEGPIVGSQISTPCVNNQFSVTVVATASEGDSVTLIANQTQAQAYIAKRTFKFQMCSSDNLTAALSSPSLGAGTLESRKVICTADQLAQINTINWNYYKLGADIDLDPALTGREWQPLQVSKFDLDGANHKIARLRIGPNMGASLGFGFIGRALQKVSIKNVTFEDTNLNIAGTRRFIGVVIGAGYGFVELENVVAKGSIRCDQCSFVGGIVGSVLSGSFITTAAEVSIDAPGSAYVGGVAGSFANGKVEYVAVRRFTNIIGSSSVGGVFGAIKGSEIKSSQVYANIQGTRNVGGVVGESNENVAIVATDSYGSVTGDSNIGGIVGEVLSGDSYITTEISTTATLVRSFMEVHGAIAVGGIFGKLGHILSEKIMFNGIRSYGAVTATIGTPGGLVGFREDNRVFPRKPITNQFQDCSFESSSGVTYDQGTFRENYPLCTR